MVSCLAACAPKATAPGLAETFGIAVPHLTSAGADAVRSRHELGARWVRRDLTWHEIEREPGVMDFSEADTVIDRERGAGMQVLAILDYGHPFYSGSSDPHAPPANIHAFGSYVGATVEHYKGRVAAYELWNEPNTPLFWPPWPDPAAYARLARHAAECVRAADANATIVLGGMLGNLDPLLFGGRIWGFLEEALAAEPALIDVVDAVAIHPYTWLQYAPPEAASGTQASVQVSFPDMILDARRIATAYGRPSVPIWITEQGWHTATEAELTLGVSEDEQAALMVRAHVLALSLGVERAFQFTYEDGAGDLADKESHFGMLRYAPSEPKPSLAAYATLTRMLAPTRFASDLRRPWRLGANTYAYAFDGARRIVVAWCAVAACPDLELDEAPNEMVDMIGGQETPTRRVRLGSAPLYLRL